MVSEFTADNVDENMAEKMDCAIFLFDSISRRQLPAGKSKSVKFECGYLADFFGCGCDSHLTLP